jgi:hypothetical protein
MASKLNPPISKKCQVCKVEKLLCEFEFSDNTKTRVDTCRSCVEKREENNKPYGAYCQNHFNEMVVENTWSQSDLLLPSGRGTTMQ